MRDEKDCRWIVHALQIRHELRNSLRVQMICWLVQNQQPRWTQHCAGDRYTLALPARELSSIFADVRIEAFRQIQNEIARSSQVCRTDDLRFRCIRKAVRDVVADGSRKQHSVLHDYTNRAPHRPELDFVERNAVRADPAASRSIESQDEVRERRLAGSVCAHNRHSGTRVDRDAHFIQDKVLTISEGNVFESDSTVEGKNSLAGVW